jgi:hypothetical protein
MVQELVDEVTEAIIRYYPKLGLAVDELPYTQEFDELYEKVKKVVEVRVTKHQLWKLLLRARKRGRLQRIR